MGYKFCASIFFFLFINVYVCINAMFFDDVNNRRVISGYGNSSAYLHFESQLKNQENIEKLIKNREDEFKKKEAAFDLNKSGLTIEEIAKQKKVIDDEKKQLELFKRKQEILCGLDTNENARWGRIIFKGFVGNDEHSYDQTSIDNFSSGINQGLAVRISSACGKWISSKVEATIGLVVGGAWDSLLLFSIDIFSDFCKIFFHDGKDPFKPIEVEGWQKLIIEAMRQIEKNVKDGPRDNLRGHDMTLRSFGGDDKVSEASDDSSSLNAWRMYIIGCAEQFDYLINLIEKRKGYYSEDKLIVFYAEQIQRRLRDYCDLMLKTKSVKEFDDAIESNKSLLPAMREGIEQLFKRLAEESKPIVVFSGNNDSFRKTESSSRQRQSSDDDMPHRFANVLG